MVVPFEKFVYCWRLPESLTLAVRRPTSWRGRLTSVGTPGLNATPGSRNKRQGLEHAREDRGGSSKHDFHTVKDLIEFNDSFSTRLRGILQESLCLFVKWKTFGANRKLAPNDTSKALRQLARGAGSSRNADSGAWFSANLLQMRIAQVAPLYESVPPRLYGGTERVVSYLTEELLRQGHDVTLFASGDSVTSADLRPMCQQALRLQGNRVTDPLAYHIRMIELVAKEAEDFDIVHFHIDYLHFSVSRRQKIPCVTTLHGRLDIPEIHPLFQEFPDMDLVSISDAQREPIAWANWVGTVYHGLPEGSFQPRRAPHKYLAFLGRISPEKGVDSAIEIAKRSGIPIKIAAKVDPADHDFYEEKIRHLMDHPLVEFVGEIGDSEKCEFLSGARALLFPIDWPEPFGLVMIEALACGTPVIAFSHGSVPEIIQDGVTGFVVSTVDEAAAAVGRIDDIDRNVCRSVFEQRFSARRMCSDYLDVYRRVLSSGEPDTRTGEIDPVAA